MDCSTTGRSTTICSLSSHRTTDLSTTSCSKLVVSTPNMVIGLSRSTTSSGIPGFLNYSWSRVSSSAPCTCVATFVWVAATGSPSSSPELSLESGSSSVAGLYSSSNLDFSAAPYQDPGQEGSRDFIAFVVERSDDSVLASTTCSV